MSVSKSFVCINRKAPYGTIYALEALEVVLIAGAFEQQVKLIFMDDGVYQLTRNQNPAGIGMKNFSKTFGALSDYDVDQIFVDSESLNLRGLDATDLQRLTHETNDAEERLSIKVVPRKELVDIIESADVLFNF
jgi:tRNA 2-thiouridine synthesizing protein C|tara:strand:+ start:12956 stop:13357 length:402 start_codon:yes stop_codon:yes gene_type:complete